MILGDTPPHSFSWCLLLAKLFWKSLINSPQHFDECPKQWVSILWWFQTSKFSLGLLSEWGLLPLVFLSVGPWFWCGGCLFSFCYGGVKSCFLPKKINKIIKIGVFKILKKNWKLKVPKSTCFNALIKNDLVQQIESKKWINTF
jgi:hypothetical protein